jgi:hypothetical protein
MIEDASRSIQLPASLCEAAEQRFGSRFGGLEQFLAFVLSEFTRDDVADMDIAEQRIIEQRLKDLGYV